MQDPSFGRMAAGLGTEVAGGMASQIVGGFTGPGYFVIAPVGGFLSSLAAQKIEGREDISIGRALVAGAANLIPGPAGKIGRGLKGVGNIAAKEAAKGAGIGVADAFAQAGIDEGRLPTGGELMFGAGIGGGFGGLMGGGVAGVMKHQGTKKPHLPK